MEQKPKQTQGTSLRQQMITAAQRDLPVEGIVKHIQKVNKKLASTIVNSSNSKEDEFFKFVLSVYVNWLFRVNSTFTSSLTGQASRILEYSQYKIEFENQHKIPKNWGTDEEFNNFVQQQIAVVIQALKKKQKMKIKCGEAIKKRLSVSIPDDAENFEQVNKYCSSDSIRGFAKDFTTENFDEAVSGYRNAFIGFMKVKNEEKQKEEAAMRGGALSSPQKETVKKEETPQQKQEISKQLPHIWSCLFDYSTGNEDKHTLVDILSAYIDKSGLNVHKKLTADFLIRLVYQLNPASDKFKQQQTVDINFESKEILVKLYKLLYVLANFIQRSKELDRVETSELVKDIAATIEVGLDNNKEWKQCRKDISHVGLILTGRRTDNVTSSLDAIHGKITQFLDGLKKSVRQGLLLPFEEKSCELAMSLLDLPMKKELEKLHHDEKIVHAYGLIGCLLNAKTPNDYLQANGVFDLIREGIRLSRTLGKNEASRDLELRLLELRDKIISEMLLSDSLVGKLFTAVNVKAQVVRNLEKIVSYGVPALTTVSVIQKFVGENNTGYGTSIMEYYLKSIFDMEREANGKAVNVSAFVYNNKDNIRAEIMKLKVDEFHTYAFLFNFHLNRYKANLEPEQQAIEESLINASLINKDSILKLIVAGQPECKNFEQACATLGIVSSKEKQSGETRDGQSIKALTQPHSSSLLSPNRSRQVSVSNPPIRSDGIPSLQQSTENRE